MRKQIKSLKEWWLLFFLSGYLSPKCIAIYDINSNYDTKYLYLCVGFLLIWLVSCAKLDLFNIFKLIRSIPTNIIILTLWLKNDYQYWKLNKKRIKYD